MATSASSNTPEGCVPGGCIHPGRIDCTAVAVNTLQAPAATAQLCYLLTDSLFKQHVNVADCHGRLACIETNVMMLSFDGMANCILLSCKVDLADLWVAATIIT